MQKISVITPVYNERDNIEACIRRVAEVFKGELPSWELEHIVADNASTDGTQDILRRIAANTPHLKVIFNSRNFGAPRSHFNALKSATGDGIVAFVPADLQDPPELIPKLVNLWKEGYDVVYGVRTERKETWLLRNLRNIFYRIVTGVTPFYVPRDAGDFQLIDKKVLAVLKRFNDHHPYARGMIAYCGFNSIGISYAWQTRKRGVSKETLISYFDQAINGIISFSNYPLRLCMFLGLSISLLSMFYGLYYLFFIPITTGLRALIISQFFLSGVLLFVLGILSEYVYAIYSLVRHRPTVIESERVNFDSEDMEL